MTNRIKAVVQAGGTAFVWTSDDVVRLRKERGIQGALVGALPLQPQQNRFHGLPLLLTRHEVEWLQEQDAIDLQTPAGDAMTATSYLQQQTDISELEALRTVVFSDLKRRGLIVGGGSKFGGDFAVYKSDPSECHAHSVVLVAEWTRQCSMRQLMALARVAVSAGKSLVVASQHNGSISYSCVQWADATM
ncbi:hypothetical protein RI367_002539 [Sorochytrium milnesiophthora]